MDMFFKRRFIVISILLISIVCIQTYAQTNKAKYEIGINAGTLVYQGDLSTSYFGSFHALKPAIGIFASRLINNKFAIRANLNFGKISDDESYYSSPSYKRFRNFSFNTSITELSALLVWNIIGKEDDETFPNVTPYLFGGAGLALINVHRDFSKIDRTRFRPQSTQMKGLTADSLHSLPGSIPLIPIGFGLRCAIGPNLSLAGEVNYRIVFNDYIDGFSQAGNPKYNDKYYGISIGLIYIFKSNGLGCPPMVK